MSATSNATTPARLISSKAGAATRLTKDGVTDVAVRTWQSGQTVLTVEFMQTSSPTSAADCAHFLMEIPAPGASGGPVPPSGRGNLTFAVGGIPDALGLRRPAGQPAIEISFAKDDYAVLLTVTSPSTSFGTAQAVTFAQQQYAVLA